MIPGLGLQLCTFHFYHLVCENFDNITKLLIKLIAVATGAVQCEEVHTGMHVGSEMNDLPCVLKYR